MFTGLQPITITARPSGHQWHIIEGINTILDLKSACPKSMKLVRKMGRLQCNIPVVLFVETLMFLQFWRFGDSIPCINSIRIQWLAVLWRSWSVPTVFFLQSMVPDDNPFFRFFLRYRNGTVKPWENYLGNHPFKSTDKYISPDIFLEFAIVGGTQFTDIQKPLEFTRPLNEVARRPGLNTIENKLPNVAAPVLRVLATLAEAVCCISLAEFCNTSCSIASVIPYNTSLHNFIDILQISITTVCNIGTPWTVSYCYTVCTDYILKKQRLEKKLKNKKINYFLFYTNQSFCNYFI